MSLSVLQLKPKIKVLADDQVLSIKIWFADGCLLAESSLETERNDHALVSLPLFF